MEFIAVIWHWLATWFGTPLRDPTSGRQRALNRSAGERIVCSWSAAETDPDLSGSWSTRWLSDWLRLLPAPVPRAESRTPRLR